MRVKEKARRHKASINDPMHCVRRACTLRRQYPTGRTQAGGWPTVESTRVWEDSRLLEGRRSDTAIHALSTQ